MNPNTWGLPEWALTAILAVSSIVLELWFGRDRRPRRPQLPPPPPRRVIEATYHPIRREPRALPKGDSK